jgi:hypothetical protein
MSKTDEATASSARPAATTTAESTPPAQVATGSGPARSDPAAAPPAADSPARPASSAKRPSIADAFAVPPEEEIPRRPDGKIIGITDIDGLREANAPTDALVRECIAKHGGAAVSGTLMTTYIVARKKAPSGTFKVEVETTGYEEDESTIRDPELIECVHKTALAQKFATNNNSPVATWARRKIDIKDGELTWNWVIKHGYIR